VNPEMGLLEAVECWPNLLVGGIGLVHDRSALSKYPSDVFGVARTSFLAPHPVFNKTPDRGGPEFHPFSLAPCIELGNEAFRELNGNDLVRSIRLAASGASRVPARAEHPVIQKAEDSAVVNTSHVDATTIVAAAGFVASFTRLSNHLANRFRKLSQLAFRKRVLPF
jgi:hypothetical protein